MARGVRRLHTTTIAALWLAISALMALGIRVAPAVDAITADCLAVQYWCLTIGESGDGTGDVDEYSYQMNGGAEVPSTIIQCHRGNETTTGTCVQAFNVGFTPPSSITVNLHVTPSGSDLECFGMSCVAQPLDVGLQFSGDRSQLIPFTTTSMKSVSIMKVGTGSGTVYNDGGPISCGTTCSATFDPNTFVLLTGVPDAGSAWEGWSGGGCTGTQQCQLRMVDSYVIQATFTSLATPTLSPTPKVTPKPSASATVTPRPSPTVAPTPGSVASHNPTAAPGSTPGPTATAVAASLPAPTGLSAPSAAATGEEPTLQGSDAGASGAAAASPSVAAAPPGSSPVKGAPAPAASSGDDTVMVVVALGIGVVIIAAAGIGFANARRRRSSS